MLDTPVQQPDVRPGDGRPAGHLVGREAEFDRIRAFLAAARNNGEALLVTGEPGVGKTEILDSASDAASDAGARVMRAAGIQFEAEMSFSGLNQVLLRLLDRSTELPAVHRDALNVALGFGDGAPPSIPRRVGAQRPPIGLAARPNPSWRRASGRSGRRGDRPQ